MESHSYYSILYNQELTTLFFEKCEVKACTEMFIFPVLKTIFNEIFV